MNLKHPQTCLSAELLKQLSHDDLTSAELKDIEEHVGGCHRCRNLLDAAQSDPQWQDEIVPILKTPLESPHADDHDGVEGESLESILRLLGPTDDPHMLGRIGTYEVAGVIGRGGMGVVFKAFEPALNRFVAIKMLLPHLAASGAARKRFAREGQAAAAVIDDHVMPIYSVAEWQGVPYLVTQYSRGTTLQKRMRDQGPLEVKEILRIGMQTARGLAAAHAQGLVHRDVKPSNILLDGTVERALLTDFGLARAVDDASITRTGVIAGTPQYMSPEQASGGSVDARSDLFSLGCVLYAMCTGRPPFRADNSHAILRMITDDEPCSIREINPDIPDWLCMLISQMMAKSPAARFERASEVADVLEQCLAHVQQPSAVALPGSLSQPITRTVTSRHRTFFMGVLVMIGSLLLGLVAMLALPEGSSPNVTDESLEGVWELVLPPDIAAELPEDQRLRLVIAGDWQGTFRGDRRVSASWLRVEPQHKPKRLAFVGVEGEPVRGIYEVKDDGLRLSIAPDTAALPTRFGTEHPEFKRVTGKLAEEQIVALKQFSEKPATAGASTESDPTGNNTKIDKSTLPKVANNFHSPTTVLNGLVSGGGIIERIEGDIMHFTSGDRIVVPAGTMLLLPKHGERPIAMHKSDVLEPGMTIAYSLRDGKIEQLVLMGIVEHASGDASVFDTIKELQLRKGSELSTSIDGWFPLRITGSDGEVAVRIGETKLIRLPMSTEFVEWRVGEYTPEGIDDFEPFDYVLVQWRDNGRISFTCYALPPKDVPDAVDAPHAKEPISDSALDGTWAFVSIEGGVDGATNRKFEGEKDRYVFDGNNLIQQSMGDDGSVRKSGEFAITLNTNVTPREMTLKTSDHRSIRYIYEIKGDTLRMCYFALGEQDGKEIVALPGEFSIDKRVELYPTLMTLKRVDDKKNAEGESAASVLERAFRQMVSDVDAGPIWGETIDGLQLGMSGINPDRQFKSGDTIRFRLSVRNVSNEVIRFRYNHSQVSHLVAPEIVRKNGVRVRFPIMHYRGGHKSYNETLEPDAVVPLQIQGVLVLGESESAQKHWPRIEKPESGEYTLRAVYLIEPLDANGEIIIQRDRGNVAKSFGLTSGTVTIHID